MTFLGVLQFIIRIIFILAIWLIVPVFAFAIAGKDGGNYALDQNYMIGGWPGYLWERGVLGGFREVPMQNKVEAYAFVKNYIVLKAGTDWVVIDRDYRIITTFSNLQDVKQAIKIPAEKKISFATRKPWLRMVYFWHALAVSVGFGVLLLVLGFFSEIKEYFRKRRQEPVS